MMTERHKDRLRSGTVFTRVLEGFRQYVKTLTFLGAAGVTILVSSLTSANAHEPLREPVSSQPQEPGPLDWLRPSATFRKLRFIE